MTCSRALRLTGQALVGVVILGVLLLLLSRLPSWTSDRPPETASADNSNGQPSLQGHGVLSEDPSNGTRRSGTGVSQRELCVRDLGTGEIVVGIPLFGQTGGQRIEIGTTKEDSSTVIEASELETIRIQSQYWTQVTMSAAESLVSGVIWVYGPMRLRVRVEDETGKTIPAEDVELHLMVLQPPGTGLSLLSAPPWNKRWYRDHGIRKTYPLQADSAGVVSVVIPRLRYLGVRARTRERRSELVELVVPSASEPHVPELDVRIRVQSIPKVTGVVLDPQGQPVSGAVVQINVFRDIPFNEADSSRVYEPGEGMTIKGNTDGTATVKWSAEVVTGEDGEYSISVSQSGRAVLQALKHHYIPYCVRILVDASTTSHDVSLEPDGDYPTVQLLWKGRPLPAQDLMAGDITDLRQQTSHAVTVDERGRIRDGWLRHGCHYGLVFALPPGSSDGNAIGRARRFIAWHGGSEIELSSLHVNLSEFKASTR